jgi:hypothetical protein
VGNSKSNGESSGLVLETSLQGFFYDQLTEFNKKSTDPLPNEAIFYSSLVMDKFGEAQNLFEVNDEGKIQDKVLGVKLLECTHFPKEKQKRVLKDVGDTALLLCGYFSDSLNKKLVDTRYYQDLGQIAYCRLDSMVPQAYEVPAFYKNISTYFQKLTIMMNLVSEKTLNNDSFNSDYILFVSQSLKVKAS